MSDLTARIQRYADDLIASYPDVTVDEVLTARMRPARFHPVLVAAAAAVVVLIVIGGVALLVGHTGRPVIDTSTTLPAVTTTLPATTATASTTTTPSTSTTQAATPVPEIAWTRIDNEEFTAPGRQVPNAVTVVDQNVVLVGGATEVDEDFDAAVWRWDGGSDWQRFDSPEVFGGTGSQVINGFAVLGDTIVAVGEGNSSSAAVWVSTDAGQTWTRVPGNEDAFANRWMNAVIATSDGFIAVGSGVWTSTDGLDWSLVEDIPDEPGLLDVAAFRDGYVAVGRSNSQDQTIIWRSDDGTAWTPARWNDGFLAPFSFSDMAVVPDGLVMVGCGGGGNYCHGEVYISSNGAIWDRVLHYTEGRSLDMSGVAAVGDTLVVVGGESNSMGDHASGLVWESADAGRTWVPIGNPDDVFGDYRRDVSGIEQVTTYHNGYVAAGFTGASSWFWLDDADIAVWIGTIEG
jgi:hypothetical protein